MHKGKLKSPERVEKRAKIVPVTSPIEEMARLETSLKSAVSIEAPNIDEAISIIDSLDAMSVSAPLLQECKSLVATVKKIRRYRASETLMAKADKLYNRYKLVFSEQTNT